MRQQSETRANAYRRSFETYGFEPGDVRRAQRILVRADRRPARPEPPPDWLCVYESELDDALLEYEELRTAGRPTTDLADYIDYLADCVFALHADPKRGLRTVAARRGIAPA